MAFGKVTGFFAFFASFITDEKENNGANQDDKTDNGESHEDIEDVIGVMTTGRSLFGKHEGEKILKHCFHESTFLR